MIGASLIREGLDGIHTRSSQSWVKRAQDGADERDNGSGRPPGWVYGWREHRGRFEGSRRRLERRGSAYFEQPRRLRPERSEPERGRLERHARFGDHFRGEERAPRQRHADAAGFAGPGRIAS